MTVAKLHWLSQEITIFTASKRTVSINLISLINESPEMEQPDEKPSLRLQQVLDLSFVYDLLRECYSMGARPSIDPVVLWHRCNW